MIGAARLLDGVDVGVGGDRDLTAEDPLIERERLSSLAAEVDMVVVVTLMASPF